MSDFAAEPVLTGDVVVLRPFRADDLPVLAAIIDDPEVRRFTGSAHLTFTMPQLQSVYQARAHQADRLDLAVTDKATGELVGEVVLNQWDQHNRSCNFRTFVTLLYEGTWFDSIRMSLLDREWARPTTR